ncbi:MAG: hypothetical protein TR69_WS6001001038 [candidate division WS6 bacterium OLB20]|uniref:Uncharacterized protein n=1 Tax=candidate division WS6 bacterium OLB20 TaxID=1617426 RepID=A0A136LZD9_9BACT|nr:MAG: hypothetical protein TR69_WS6001001038 [candidate division WS6 bacterium OLB20]
MKFIRNKTFVRLAVIIPALLFIALAVAAISAGRQSIGDNPDSYSDSYPAGSDDRPVQDSQDQVQPTDNPETPEDESEQTPVPSQPGQDNPTATPTQNPEPTGTPAGGGTTQQTKTYQGQKYSVTIQYPHNWTGQSSFVGPSQQVESFRTFPDDNLSFNVSFYPPGSFVSIRQDYDKIAEKQITINGSTYTSARYEGYYDPDEGDERPDDLIVITVDSGSFVAEIQSYFDPSSYSNGWDIINSVAAGMEF